jgi:hypothetical protein
MSTFKFTVDNDKPASGMYGPGVRVVERASGEVLGWVRRIDSVAGRWQVYGSTGEEIAVADLRSTAANFLLHDARKARES